MPPPVLAENGFFWVGVERQQQGEATFATGQMFARLMVPAERRHRWPVVMVHGGGGQGLDWMGTPDGRPGWSDAFLHRGHAVCVVDRPGLGRAPAQGPQTPPPSYEMMRARFTAPATRPESYPQARLHTQWPPGEEVLDQFMAGQGPSGADLAVVHAGMRRAAAALLDRIGPAVLLTHSAGGAFGWLAADARPELVRAIVAIEPIGPPFAATPTGALRWGLTAAPLTYDPPLADPAELATVPRPAPGPGLRDCLVQAAPARRLPNLARCPIAVVTAEASWKAAEDHGVVDYLRQAGATVDHLRLEQHGLHGNGHMMMLEMNSDAVAALVAGWIEARD
ncbi:alpha/beta hydrolase [Paracraurococcus lichenis]|uniref:Alpha/beta hydrolase n=1 Tax=Paracraurococcus lichenis TaxID=3064888 RepID=A0ABT9EDT9_9PROT|nr:alpha/beta hydrolase [Paracraurococcus sp. LOR1-02]MDO9714373.1 alpha/beta hydrolase [Paracraurococcus sp. LOR1-02]